MYAEKAKQALRRGVITALGGLLLAVGLGLLTAAAWIAIAGAAGHLVAALSLGLIYSGIGLILVAVSGRSAPPEPARPQRPEPPPQPDMMQAFFKGMGAGVAARKGFDRGRKGEE